MRRAARVLLRLAPVAALGVLALGASFPTHASAHPLGNFTINHYAEVRVGRDAIVLDVVVDMAEIPAFTEQRQLDTNADGTISPAELAAARLPACTRLGSQLRLAMDARPMALETTAAGMQLLPGAGGLNTLRTVCEFDAPLGSPISAATSVSFADGSYAERIGWREIVVTGDGVTARSQGSSTTSISRRLTQYPTDLLAQPLDQRSVAISVTPGGASLPRLLVPDAQALGAGGGSSSAVASLAGAVPGGVGDQLSSLLEARDLTPLVLLFSLLAAAGLGAVHAVSPGHGKTVMAAYLVGTRGRARHAIGLALAVTVSHTAGVLVLAALTLGASDLIPPERLYPVLGLASGLTVVGIGAWLLLARWRDLRHGRAHAHDHGHPHEGDHDGVHRHGPISHSHARATEARLTWRSLLALGLAGGLVPSASALLLLLGSVAAGRPAFGLALAIAFGVGMAVVLGGIGLALASAGRLLEHAPKLGGLGRLAPVVPWATAVVVLGAGLLLTGQALVTQL
jgi:ABC-type nickel/cobalt efflux system permease component RcnA